MGSRLERRSLSALLGSLGIGLNQENFKELLCELQGSLLEGVRPVIQSRREEDLEQ